MPRPSASGCLEWPEPDLSKFPCGATIPDSTIEEWLPSANEMVFAETGARFPGTVCTAKVSVRGVGLCGSSSTSRADLFPTIPYPILELLAVEVDGTADPDALAYFEISEERFLEASDPLAPADPWVSAWWDPPALGSELVFEVRYGRTPEPLVVKARDQLLWSLIMANDPPLSDHCRIVDGVTTLSENGRTITLEPVDFDSKLLAWVRKRYRRRRIYTSNVYDLAESEYSPTVRLVG